MSYVLEVKNLSKYYSNGREIIKAVNNVSFTAEQGEYIGIMGSSGSGKTTLLNCIATIDQPTSGDVWIDDMLISEMRRNQLAKVRSEKIGFVFQDYGLLDTLDVSENIALPFFLNGGKNSVLEKRILNLMQIIDIEHLKRKYPYQLSGGEKQRVAIARALICNPSIILADEPTGALDSKNAARILELFSTLNQKQASTILMVTHDAFAASHCKRVMFIRDGKIFTEIIRGEESRKEYLENILEVIGLLGGELCVS